MLRTGVVPFGAAAVTACGRLGPAHTVATEHGPFAAEERLARLTITREIARQLLGDPEVSNEPGPAAVGAPQPAVDPPRATSLPSLDKLEAMFAVFSSTLSSHTTGPQRVAAQPAELDVLAGRALPQADVQLAARRAAFICWVDDQIYHRGLGAVPGELERFTAPLRHVLASAAGASAATAPQAGGPGGAVGAHGRGYFPVMAELFRHRLQARVRAAAMIEQRRAEFRTTAAALHTASALPPHRLRELRDYVYLVETLMAATLHWLASTGRFTVDPEPPHRSQEPAATDATPTGHQLQRQSESDGDRSMRG
ncbi:hypothetical protein [Kitasatospora sp. NPDC050543]|uniref:hypothetical protein n=1 Tax=Kitasatospora sp. NPDC050543 TaxID=3364054 RepID=UPI0037A61040